ncbi:MAG: hypothetical protein Fur0037_00160 [Planctomycetota bacterium]
MSRESGNGDRTDDFLKSASGKDRGLIGEFRAFMAENKAWWMAPILVVLGLVAVLLILGATPAGAFLYTFF